MPEVYVSGISSGLDWRTIVEQLMAIERRPITKLENRKAEISTAKSIWEDVKSKLAALGSALTDLKFDSTYQAKSAASSDDKIVEASASYTASVGQYSIIVTQLASAHKVASDAKATDYTVPSGTGGTITITVRDKSGTLTSTDVNIADGDTLATIRDKINSVDAKVTATIINDGTGDRLVITRNETGSYSTISFTDSAGGVLKDLGILDASGAIKNELVPARDASFTVDNLPVTRSSNTITDVIPGVTLTLKNTTATAVQVSVTLNPQVAVDKIKDFVSKYNSLLKLLNDKLGKEGELQGDGTLMRLQGTLRRDVSDQVSGITTKYKSLAEIGIKTADKYGTLTIDETSLKEAIESNPSDVKQLFFNGSSSVNGVGEKLESLIDLWTAAGTGIIPGKIESLDDLIVDIGRQISALERRLELREQNLVRQFVQMEQLVGLLQSQGTWLSGQITRLYTARF